MPLDPHSPEARAVREVGCPTCGARINAPCINRLDGGLIDGWAHAGRVDAYKAIIGRKEWKRRHEQPQPDAKPPRKEKFERPRILDHSAPPTFRLTEPKSGTGAVIDVNGPFGVLLAEAILAHYQADRRVVAFAKGLHDMSRPI